MVYAACSFRTPSRRRRERRLSVRLTLRREPITR